MDDFTFKPGSGYFVGRRWISHCEDPQYVHLDGHWSEEFCVKCAEAEANPSPGYYTVTEIIPGDKEDEQQDNTPVA